LWNTEEVRSRDPCERAVRVYHDGLAQPDASKLAARRHVGELLEIQQATLRNWIGERLFTTGRLVTDTLEEASLELAGPRKEVADYAGLVRLLRQHRRFSPQRSSTADCGDVDYIDAHRDMFGVDPRLRCADRARHEDRLVHLLRRQGPRPGQRLPRSPSRPGRFNETLSYCRINPRQHPKRGNPPSTSTAAVGRDHCGSRLR
jgi:transposase